MSIFGIGIDVVNVKRISKLLKKNNDAFTKKVFSQREINFCKKKIKIMHVMLKNLQPKKLFPKQLALVWASFFSLKILKL